MKYCLVQGSCRQQNQIWGHASLLTVLSLWDLRTLEESWSLHSHQAAATADLSQEFHYYSLKSTSTRKNSRRFKKFFLPLILPKCID